MKYVKNISIWLIGLVISIISSISIMYMFDDTFYRIEESSIPENPTAFVMGGFFGTVFGVLFNIFVFVVFLILIFALKRQIKFRYLFFDKDENILQKILQVIGYVLIVVFAFNYFKALIMYQDFILSELIFYFSSIITTMFYIIITESLFKKNTCI